MKTAAKAARVIVKQDEQEPVPVVVMAQAIRDIAEGTKKLFNSGLNERALVLLISHSSGVGQTPVKAVLRALRELEATYCTPKSH